MPNPMSVLVLCGGQSTEHDISLLSAKNIIERLHPEKYHVSVAVITHDGVWQYYQNVKDYFSQTNPCFMHIIPGKKNPLHICEKNERGQGREIVVDCVFPVLHGTNGEDGTMQGLLELLHIPYVGAECLSSSLCMDKDITKRLLRAADISVVDWILIRASESHPTFSQIKSWLGEVVFIKPNSLGSSVGVKKVTSEATYAEALKNAFIFDEYVLVEKAIAGREIECSVLGNEKPSASLPGEIINHTDFYSFDAKYVDDDAATVKTPADLPVPLAQQIQTVAMQAYQTLRCVGMARVDFFLDQNDKIYINEVNTIPGFTNISMYPKNWEASGVGYAALLDELILLAVRRFETKNKLLRVYQPKEAACQNEMEK